MTYKALWIAALWLLPHALAGQSSAVITMDQEPHHHLALHNEYVKVFKVEVLPGDSILLHRHDQDTVAIAIGDQEVTVGIPGKPDVHQKNADAQVRLQRGGYIHSTRVDGNTPYHTVAVELMQPQTNFHNVCAEILPGQPLNCSSSPFWTNDGHSVVYYSLPVLESNETHVRLVHVPPHISIPISGSPSSGNVSRLVVTLDAASISSGTPKESEKGLQPGDFAWIDSDLAVVQNRSDKEVRVIDIVFPRAK